MTKTYTCPSCANEDPVIHPEWKFIPLKMQYIVRDEHTRDPLYHVYKCPRCSKQFRIWER